MNKVITVIVVIRDSDTNDVEFEDTFHTFVQEQEEVDRVLNDVLSTTTNFEPLN